VFLLSSGSLAQIANWVTQPEIPSTTMVRSTPTASSSLIPPNTSLFLQDSLGNSSNPNQWNVGTAGSITCSFADGSYHITAPANSSGGGCSLNRPDAVYNNFVYQVKMTIEHGADASLRAGLGFCWNPDKLGGSVYELKFNSLGEWDVVMLNGAAQGPTTSTTVLHGTSNAFITGIGSANYITIRASNHKIDMQVNGSPIAPTYSEKNAICGGGVGLGAKPGTESVAIAYNDARIWKLSS
jgi:hypothetical protein